ncbi:MAG: hypothetical protein KatS3mg060_2994 [Dehalococcoidia bacterium]|nr:MAG: hypothetical protein KatS3mg060_2994 [Dehalococcoidia bacterium]
MLYAVYTKLVVLPGRELDFEAALQSLYAVQQSVSSFVGGELCRLDDTPSTFLAISYWSEPDGYDRFHALPERLARLPALLETLDPVGTVHFRGEVAYRVTPAGFETP